MTGKKTMLVLLALMLAAVSLHGCAEKKQPGMSMQMLTFDMFVNRAEDYEAYQNSNGNIVSEEDFNTLRNSKQENALGLYTCMVKEDKETGMVTLYVYQESIDENDRTYELIYVKVLPEDAVEALLPILEEAQKHYR